MDRIVKFCMNPALDITTGTEVVRPIDKLRCSTPRYDPGGGGINVALVAQNPAPRPWRCSRPHGPGRMS